MAVHYWTCVCCITHIAPWRNSWKCNGLTLCCCWLLFGQCYYMALVLVHLANSTWVIADSNHFETVLAKLFSSVLKVKRDVRTFFLASYSYLCTLHFTPESLYVYVYFVMVVVPLYPESIEPVLVYNMCMKEGMWILYEDVFPLTTYIIYMNVIGVGGGVCSRQVLFFSVCSVASVFSWW